MKKNSIFFFIIIVLIVVAAVLLYVFLPPRLPAADNSTPAHELISHYYSDEELEEALAEIIESEYSRPYKYETLNDLKHIYKFECLRDPSVYSDEYKPYVVLMSDSGKKLFLFYDPETLEILERILIEDFMSLSEAQTVIKNALAINKSIVDDAVKFEKSYDEVFQILGENKSALRRELYTYSIGSAYISICTFDLCNVEEGVLVLGLWAGSEINVHNIIFYPNELVFSGEPLKSQSGYDIWPILPIDKTE